MVTMNDDDDDDDASDDNDGQEQYERRKAVFEATCERIKNTNEGDREENKTSIARGERKMAKATQVIKKVTAQ